LTASVEVPAEDLAAGPRGRRIHVVDYDATSGTLYAPLPADEYTNHDGRYRDPFTRQDGQPRSIQRLLNSPQFHAQNAYVIAMRTLARFEEALGRRITWSFRGHQLKIAPHAFAEANAFYAEGPEALLLGYFPGRKGTVFSCLSHDVIAHETTHALLAGLRRRFTDPSSYDQAAFHEGFADVVALLSVFSMREVVQAVLEAGLRKRKAPARGRRGRAVSKEILEPAALQKSVLLGLAEQMGHEMASVRGEALRQSGILKPDPDILGRDEFKEAHRRGEVLVAAVLQAFIAVWSERAMGLRDEGGGTLDSARAAEEGCAAADYLLTMAIRAIDYTPPVHLTFGDFLSAMLTADAELRPDDSVYRFRTHLRETFAGYGIQPAAKSWAPANVEPGLWQPAPDTKLTYDLAHFEPLQRDPDEVFGFVWENRQELYFNADAFTQVLSVRPCVRVAPDGLPLRETVAEVLQILELTAGELWPRCRIKKPAGMPDAMTVRLFGGSTLIFDEFGRLKFEIHNRVGGAKRQQARLEHLWASGALSQPAERLNFSEIHRRRAEDRSASAEGW
jgi:hypothetical protein